MRAWRSLVCALLACVVAGPGPAQGDSLGPLRIEDPWSRETPPGAPVGVGYLSITNAGAADDRLVAADSPRAARVTLHRSIEAEGTARMERQHDGIAIPAGATVTLAPGGYHLMLMQLEQPLREEERVPVTLHFERAGTIEVELEVRDIAAGVD